MNKITDELYERFKTNLEKVDGRCVRSSAEDLGKTLAGLMKPGLMIAIFLIISLVPCIYSWWLHSARGY